MKNTHKQQKIHKQKNKINKHTNNIKNEKYI